MIPFNKPFFSGNELEYIKQSVASGKISGDGMFTKKCHAFFEQECGIKKALLTTSCTAALEMAAILLDIKEGDEVIMPSYTFVSTANAFVLRGAKIVFTDSSELTPNIDELNIESLITGRTKVIVVVHYGGVACNMDFIVALAKKYGLFVVEDAAHATDSYYKGRLLGTIGEFGTFSFHETKNIIAGEGGMLAVNDVAFIKRAEIVREKGTNRSAFFRGETDKYNWVDIGSSYLPSDILAAFLFAQIENLKVIQQRRIAIWNLYCMLLRPLEEAGFIRLPEMPDYATQNGHVFYILCRNLEERTALIVNLKASGILAVFHYLSLHRSAFFQHLHDNRILHNADRYTDTLLRLPLFFELADTDIEKIVNSIKYFYGV